MNVVDKAWLALLKISEGICAVLVLAMCAIVAVEVVSRTVFSQPTIWVQECAVYMLLALAFLGLAATDHADEHIRIDLLSKRLPARVRAALELSICAAITAFACTALWGGWDMVAQSLRFGRRSLTLLSIPVWMPQLLLPVGMALLVLAMIARMRRVVRNLRSGAGA